MRKKRRNNQIEIFIFISLLLISCPKKPDEFLIPSGPEGWTGCDPLDPIRLTYDRDDSRMPSIVSIGNGTFILIWKSIFEGREVVKFRKFDFSGIPKSEEKSLNFNPEDLPLHKLKIVNHWEGVLLLFVNREFNIKLKLIDNEGVELGESPILGTTSYGFLPDIVELDNYYLVAWFSNSELNTVTFPSKSEITSFKLNVKKIPLPPGDEISPGNISLLKQAGRLFFMTDSINGDSLQLGEVVALSEVKKLVQIISDKKHPLSIWHSPLLEKLSTKGLALFWEGPGRGINSIYHGYLNPNLEPYGVQRRIEAMMTERTKPKFFLGEAPMFDIDSEKAPYGIALVYGDTRSSNSEINLLPLRCRK